MPGAGLSGGSGQVGQPGGPGCHLLEAPCVETPGQVVR